MKATPAAFLSADYMSLDGFQRRSFDIIVALCATLIRKFILQFQVVRMTSYGKKRVINMKAMRVAFLSADYMSLDGFQRRSFDIIVTLCATLILKFIL